MPLELPELSDVTALVLCGGLGTRLRNVLGAVPKALGPIAGRPFIDYQLSYIRQQGVADVVLCTGHAGDQIEDYCKDGANLGVRIRYSHETQPLGTAGALRQAQPLIGSNPFLVMNGDSFIGADLGGLLRTHGESGAAVTIGVVQVPDVSRFGAVTLDPAGVVTAFGEKGRTGPGDINAGVYVMDSRMLDRVTSGRPVSLEYDIFPSLVGRDMQGMVVPGPFLDIGTEYSYQRAEEFLAGWSWGMWS